MGHPRKPPPPPEFPIEGFEDAPLKAFLDEVLRQRASYVGRSSNANTRAAVLIGVSGVFGGTALVTASSVLWVEILSLALYFGAAVCGLVAMRSTSSSEVDVEALLTAESQQPLLHVERAIAMTNVVAHQAKVRTLKVNAVWLRVGFLLLVLAWAASGAGTIWHLAQPGGTTPTVVRIQGDVHVSQH